MTSLVDVRYKCLLPVSRHRCLHVIHYMQPILTDMRTRVSP